MKWERVRSDGLAAQVAAAAETFLWVLGAGALAIVLWMLADTYWFQHRAERRLAREWRNVAASAPSDEAPSRLDRIVPPRRPIAADTPLAEIAIPRLGLEAVVAEGTTNRVLRHAVGHIESSARPREDGNIALAAHRDSFFRRLGELREGDHVELESAAGTDLYRVEWTAVVEPWQVSVAAYTGYPALTLVTCYPFEYVGHAPQRFVVRARRIDEVARSGEAGDAS